MKRLMGIRTAATLWLALAATGAQATEATAQQCLTPSEAGGLFLALAPDALKAVGKACATTLPPGALLRQTDGPFMQKYQAEAAHSDALAQAAILKLVGKRDKAMVDALGADGFRHMMTAVLMPKLADAIKPKDCPVVERVLASLEPLPPRNMADLLVTIIEAVSADKQRKGQKVDIPICPSEAQ